MHYIIRFWSAQFDLAGEMPNPINPIPGLSIGLWLSPLLAKKGIKVTKIHAEDWGWYHYAIRNDRTYLVGYVGFPDEGDGAEAELLIQIDKRRSFMEIVTFKNRMDENDALVKLVHDLVGGIGDVRNIDVSKDG